MKEVVAELRDIGAGGRPEQKIKIIRDGLAEALDGADAEAITAALRTAGFDEAFADQLTADLTGEKPSDASRDGDPESRWRAEKKVLAAGVRRGIEQRLRGREKVAVEDVEAAFTEHLVDYLASGSAMAREDLATLEKIMVSIFEDLVDEGIMGDLVDRGAALARYAADDDDATTAAAMREALEEMAAEDGETFAKTLEMTLDGLAEVLDGADAEALTAALRKVLDDESSDDDGEADKPKRTRAAAAAEEEDDPELMAAAMREALEEMAGEQDGTSAEMLQLIRENLEEALTGEYAGELREALRKAGVEDALGVFEDFVEENLGDLLDDDDESEEM